MHASFSLRAAAFGLAIALASGGAARAQYAPPGMGEPQETPSCAEALPQIEALVKEAEGDGIDTSGAKAQIDAARTAQGKGAEAECIRALVLAQNDVVLKLQARAPGAAPAAPAR
ncbi:hypothetical protein [Aurantimonas sp. Leaf443]|uniref:hypothetical protein n=1 Tax=Aurantimonas sp. Leaf443 TaxID=1736378 RepID=UPI0006FDEDD9|nr:hypothetical protein [Aurantimonas sp. Leaf443]KQT87440.1 hypothetical protein ASG48_16720 [Aurantimonas sp. Leaf443]